MAPLTAPHAVPVPHQQLALGQTRLAVGPGVLIPRPETEMFFPDFVAGAVRANPGLAQGPWLDLGTGSGAIAIAAAGLLCKKTR